MVKLHSAEDAIKQAVEAGWRRYLDPNRDAYKYDVWVEFSEGRILLHRCEEGKHNDEICGPLDEGAIAEALTQPAFWQALGKARGWKDRPTINGTPFGREKLWFLWAMRYFETLLSGEDMTKFWESLP